MRIIEILVVGLLPVIGMLLAGTGTCAERRLNVSQFVYEKTLKSLPSKSPDQARRIADTIMTESKMLRFDPLFIMAVIAHESHFDSLARGGHGEIGLMQLKPDTAEWVSRVSGLSWSGRDSLANPETNIKLGTRYLAMLRKKFDVRNFHYLTAYNMGETRLRKLLLRTEPSMDYSSLVIRHFVAFRSQLAGAGRRPGGEVR